MRKILLTAGAVIAVLALLILIPTSPALIVDMPQTLLTIPTSMMDAYGSPFALSVTVYGVFVAAGAALAMALTAFLGKKEPGAFSCLAMTLVSGAFALVCSHLLFCVLRWGYIINDLGETPMFLLQPFKGGYTMYGAILGGLLGVAVYARVSRRPIARLMDVIVPGMALLLMLGRVGEAFTLQGTGTYVANEALSMLPFVVTNEWGEPKLLVWAYEAIVAAAALAVSLAYVLRKAPAGRAAEMGLGIISVAQIMLDSWRGDELIRFGFVRLNMIAAAVVAAFITASRIWRRVRRSGWTAWTIARIPLLLGGAGVVIALEFALDKSTINNTLLYGVMTLAILAMGAAVLVDDGRTGGKPLK